MDMGQADPAAGSAEPDRGGSQPGGARSNGRSVAAFVALAIIAVAGYALMFTVLDSVIRG